MLKEIIGKEYEIQICLLSDGDVGKTAILDRICKNIFNENIIGTFGGGYRQKTMLLNNGIKIIMHIWDTNGSGSFRSMTNLYYRVSQVIVFVYDVTNILSFEGLIDWINELKYNDEMNNKILYLVWNKIDRDKSEIKVLTSKGKEIAEKNNMIFYEISAKTGFGVKELFINIANKGYELLTKK